MDHHLKLPISSKQLLKQLDEWKIIYKHFTHKPLISVKESKLLQGKLFGNKKEIVFLVSSTSSTINIFFPFIISLFSNTHSDFSSYILRLLSVFAFLKSVLYYFTPNYVIFFINFYISIFTFLEYSYLKIIMKLHLILILI